MKEIYKPYFYILTLLFICTISGLYGCNSNNDSNNNKTQDSSKTVKPKNDVLNEKVTIEVKNKASQHGDPKDPKDARDYNAITYKLTNNTDKDIRQVEADVMIEDLAGDEIKPVSISYIEGIPAKGNIEYKGLYNYNAFNEKDVLLFSTDIKSLKFNSNIVRIGYRDGSIDVP